MFNGLSWLPPSVQAGEIVVFHIRRFQSGTSMWFAPPSTGARTPVFPGEARVVPKGSVVLLNTLCDLGQTADLPEGILTTDLLTEGDKLTIVSTP